MEAVLEKRKRGGATMPQDFLHGLAGPGVGTEMPPMFQGAETVWTADNTRGGF